MFSHIAVARSVASSRRWLDGAAPTAAFRRRHDDAIVAAIRRLSCSRPTAAALPLHSVPLCRPAAAESCSTCRGSRHRAATLARAEPHDIVARFSTKFMSIFSEIGRRARGALSPCLTLPHSSPRLGTPAAARNRFSARRGIDCPARRAEQDTI